MTELNLIRPQHSAQAQPARERLPALSSIPLKEMVLHSPALLKATVQLQNAAVEEVCGEKHPFMKAFESRVYGIVA